MSRVDREAVDLGNGYSVEFEWRDGGMVAVWSPDLPPKSVGRELLPAYRRARDAFLAKLGASAGLKLAAVDL